MNPLLIALVVMALLGLVWLLMRGRNTQQSSSGTSKPKQMEAVDTVIGWPPTATRLMTTEERKAYVVLRQALPDHMILAQVPLARFMKVPTRYSYAEWMRRAGQLCVDVLICDGSSKVVAVIDIRRAEIEESDRTHKRHARMDRVLKAAGIAVHVWREDRLPSVSAAREQILKSQSPQTELATQEGGASVSTRGQLSKLAPTLNSELDLPPGDDAPLRDAPPSTWFDDLDSAPVPLSPSKAKKHWG